MNGSQDETSVKELFAGRIAKVISISNDATSLYIQTNNGLLTHVSVQSATTFKQGDILLVNDDHMEKAPDNLWTENYLVGVVRKVLEKELLIDTGIGFRLIPHSNKKEVFSGNTVSFSEIGEVRSVISETPIRVHNFGQDDETSIDKLVLP